MDPSLNEKTGETLLEKKSVSRRDFLDYIIQGGLLATFMAMLLPALSYLWPVTRRGPAGGMMDVGLLDEIPIGGSKKVVVEGSVFLLVRTDDGVKAFSAICTHLGCVVAWDAAKKQIECPCHAGVFDLDGRVVSGPPPRPLPIHLANIVDGKIYIQV
ncbi:MAG: Rieske 2Fe-2S domain-containing protein [Candidatus Omnitrophota bacterium]|nr:Rieske 2Fe-2S domain-containing protein [Candidatus Omnitrophota bacterium]